MSKNERYRNEWKYLIDTAQKELICQRLEPLMTLDKHATNGGYMLRSLYFDDRSDSCMEENDAGVDLRRKFRIRVYDPAQQNMHLEIKEKIHGFTRKSACTITRDECLQLMGSDILPGFDHRKQLNALKLEMRTAQMQPKAIISYDRSAFVSPLGNVRITFDRNIQISTQCHAFLQDTLPGAISLLPAGLHVLEVKYDELIPDYLLQLIQSIHPQRTAFSKYYLGRRAAQGDFCHFDDDNA